MLAALLELAQQLEQVQERLEQRLGLEQAQQRLELGAELERQSEQALERQLSERGQGRTRRLPSQASSSLCVRTSYRLRYSCRNGQNVRCC